MTRPQRPRLFIGSSVEGLDVARALQSEIEFDAEATVWNQGLFAATSSVMEALEQAVRDVDFAVLILTPDDVVAARGVEQRAPRDNLIFELGLFLGALGRERVFHLVARHQELRLPTDLLGIEPLRYDAGRTDGNLWASIGPSAHEVRRAMRRLGRRPISQAGSPVVTGDQLLEELLQTWNGPELAGARTRLRQPFPFHMLDDEDGTAAPALRRVLSFLNGVADAVLSGSVEEPRARADFGGVMRSVWERAHGFFVPPGMNADEAWSPAPPVATLLARWR